MHWQHFEAEAICGIEQHFRTDMNGDTARTMSQENMEIVRTAVDAFNDGDWDAYARAFAPGVVVVAPEGWPDGPDSVGINAWLNQTKRLRDGWAEARIEVEQIRLVGNDRVLGQFRYVTRGEDSGLAFDTPMAALYALEEQKITWAQFFRDPAHALEAVGLSE